MNKFFISLVFFLKQKTEQEDERSVIFRQIPKTYFEIRNISKYLFIGGTHTRRREFILRPEVAAHA